MGEATFYARHGFSNILYPYAATSDKLRRALALKQKGVQVFLGIDHE